MDLKTGKKISTAIIILIAVMAGISLFDFLAYPQLAAILGCIATIAWYFINKTK